jgi:hypothetical protein
MSYLKISQLEKGIVARPLVARASRMWLARSPADKDLNNYTSLEIVFVDKDVSIN